MDNRISGISETMLIPLRARATETRRGNGIVHDEKACRILNPPDYNLDRFPGQR